MIIQFGHINNSLGTRSLGQEIRFQIENSLQNGEFVTFDFEGVDSVSHSFADECFGKLLLAWRLEDLKSKSTFKNISDNLRKTVSFTLKERLLELEKSSSLELA